MEPPLAGNQPREKKSRCHDHEYERHADIGPQEQESDARSPVLTPKKKVHREGDSVTGQERRQGRGETRADRFQGVQDVHALVAGAGEEAGHEKREDPKKEGRPAKHAQEEDEEGGRGQQPMKASAGLRLSGGFAEERGDQGAGGPLQRDQDRLAPVNQEKLVVPPRMSQDARRRDQVRGDQRDDGDAARRTRVIRARLSAINR